MISRKKTSMYNLIYGIIGSFVTTIFAIIIPRFFILSYGSEMNGLLQAVRQIYVYLALLEVGVGEASVLALYGPVAKGNKSAINEILSATNYYYKRIGCIYFLGVMGLGLFFPLTLETNIPYQTVCMIIILQGMGGVINYWVQGKYNMLLRVDNRSYVTTNLGTITSILIDISRIILLFQGRSIIAIQLTYLIFNLIKMIYVSWYIKKHYKWLDLTVQPNLNALNQKNSVIIHQISGLVFSNTDILILTYICGLKTVSIYSMYAMIYGMVNNVIQIIANSVNAALGQIFNSDRKKYEEIQEAYETYYLALVFALFTIVAIFILPFMGLYTRGADINYIDKKIVVLFTIYQLLNYGRNSSGQIIGFAGCFKQTQSRAIIETVINLIVSLTCVFKWGIYGVLLGTIAALLYRANDMIYYANVIIMKRSPWPTYRRWILNFGVLLVCVFVNSKLQLQINSYVMFAIYGVVIGSLIFILFLVVNSISEKKARGIALHYVREIFYKR